MQGKGKSMYNDRQAMDLRRRRQIRNWIILIVLVVAVFTGLRVLSNMGKTTEIGAVTMPCYANQDVTPFADGVLYYDGASIHCLSATGAVKWSFPVGSGATFSVSDNHMVVWIGSQLFIVDKNGRPSYNENMGAEIQFARVGESYAAVVLGDDTAPDLVIKDLQGSQVDEEAEAFNGMLLLDLGFYGEKGQYMWTLAMDVYGTAINTVMNTFQVGKMNTGEVSLGDNLTYKVLFEDNKLRVFTTQQMYTYDYKAVQDVNSSMLVYGWKLIDHHIPSRGSASMLLAPQPRPAPATALPSCASFPACWTAATPCPAPAWAPRCRARTCMRSRLNTSTVRISTASVSMAMPCPCPAVYGRMASSASPATAVPC